MHVDDVGKREPLEPFLKQSVGILATPSRASDVCDVETPYSIHQLIRRLANSGEEGQRGQHRLCKLALPLNGHGIRPQRRFVVARPLLAKVARQVGQHAPPLGHTRVGWRPAHHGRAPRGTGGEREG